MSQSGILNRGVYPPGTVVETLTGNTGGPVGPSASNNINIVGSGEIDVVGDPGDNTLTISLSGTVGDSYVTNDGTAEGIDGVINILGIHGINTSAPGDSNTIDIAINNTISLGDITPVTGSTLTITSGNINLHTSSISGGAPASGFITTSGASNTPVFASYRFAGTFAGQNAGGLNIVDGILNAFANAAFGDRALGSLTTGSENGAFGDNALSSLQTGVGCTAVGYNSLRDNVQSFLTAFGYQSLSSNTIGTYNTGVGSNALSSITDNSYCTAIGYGSLINNTASFCTAVGARSAASNTFGSYNCAIGPAALFYLIDGDANLAIGPGSDVFSVGSAYTTNESNNLVIYNSGVIGESNVIRIGTTGSGAFEQNTCYIAGIQSTTSIDAATVVGISGDQLGTTTLTEGTGITITPSAGAVTIATSGGIATTYAGNTGTAAPSGGTINIVGSGTITTSASGSTVTISATGTIVLTYTNVNTSPYTVVSTDEYLSVDCSGGAITLKFPNAPTTGRVYIVKDRTGNAQTNNITITTVGGAVDIDGATSYTMNTQHASIQLLFNGTSYEIF